jgi:hypothetical protein
MKTGRTLQQQQQQTTTTTTATQQQRKEQQQQWRRTNRQQQLLLLFYPRTLARPHNNYLEKIPDNFKGENCHAPENAFLSSVSNANIKVAPNLMRHFFDLTGGAETSCFTVAFFNSFPLSRHSTI